MDTFAQSSWGICSVLPLIPRGGSLRGCGGPRRDQVRGYRDLARAGGESLDLPADPQPDRRGQKSHKPSLKITLGQNTQECPHDPLVLAASSNVARYFARWSWLKLLLPDAPALN